METALRTPLGVERAKLWILATSLIRSHLLFFPFSLHRNQAMRKKLILYFKRRNHARKQWVSDSLAPHFRSVEQCDLLCEKDKDVFQQSGAGARYFACCILRYLLCLKHLGCKGEVPESCCRQHLPLQASPVEQTRGAGLITAEPFIDLREPIHSINVYFVSN